MYRPFTLCTAGYTRYSCYSRCFLLLTALTLITVIEGGFFDINLHHTSRHTTPNLVTSKMRTYTKHKLRKGEQKVVWL